MFLVMTARCSKELLFDMEGSAMVEEYGKGSGYGYGSGSGSGEGSGEESGSGSDISPSPSPSVTLECVAPSDFVTINEDDMVLRAKCRVSCLEKVLKGVTLNIEDLNDNMGTKWTTISPHSLQDHCDIYAKVYECQVGCEMGKIAFSEASEVSNCASDCVDQCRDMDLKAFPIYLPESVCLRTCNPEQCNLGCQAYLQLPEIEDVGDPPSFPNGSFTMVPHSTSYLHTAAAYKLEYEPDIDFMDRFFLTSFVIEISTDELITHTWLASLNDVFVIDSSLICEVVSVRFIPVNKFGRAQNYSNSVTVVPYRDYWPAMPDHPAPYTIQFQMEDDNREGFWDHAVVDITWLSPNKNEYLKYFTIKLNSSSWMCGQSKEITVDKDQLSFTWKADIPGDSPIGNCIYEIQILSNPHNETYPGATETRSILITTSNPVPDNHTSPVEVNCKDSYSETHFNFKIEWTLPSNPSLIEGIDSFVLTLIKWKEFLPVEINKDPIPFNQIKYSEFQRVDHENIEFDFFTQELTVIFKPGYTNYIPENHLCEYQPAPPPPVENINLNYLFINEDGYMDLDIEWDKPEGSDDNAIYYNLYFGPEILNGATSIEPVNTLIWLDHMDTTSFKIDNMNVSDKVQSKSELYIQIRSLNVLGLYSNWSKPLRYDPESFVINIEVSCDRNVTITPLVHLYSLGLLWQLPSDNRILKSIEEFIVHPWAIEPSQGRIRIAFQEPIVIKASSKSKTKYQAIYPDVPSDAETTTTYFELELQTIFKENYKFAELNYTCRFDAQPFPPTEVQAITLDNLSINQYGFMDISLTWEQPKITAGGIFEYILYIGTSVLSNSTKDRPDDYILWAEEILYEGYSESIYVADSLPANADLWTFYVQVLANSNLRSKSNWTTPIYNEVIPFNIVPTETPSVENSVHVSPSSQYSPSPEKPTKDTTGNSNTQFDQLVPLMSAVLPVIFVLVVAIVVVSVLLIVAYCQKKHLKSEKQTVKSGQSGYGITNPLQYVDSWEIVPMNLKKKVFLGEGKFGDVYSGVFQGVMKGKRENDNEEVEVFVETLRESATLLEIKEFHEQLNKYKKISEVEHPFLISLLGCVMISTPKLIITEHTRNGDLLSFLLKHRQKLEDELLGHAEVQGNPYMDTHNPYLHIHPGENTLTSTAMISYSRQIASAMDCLTGLGIVHGDLACRNVYVDHGQRIKVADFGVVTNGRRWDEIYPNDKPLRWMAIETINDINFTSKSDVWAFGVTVWEIISIGGFPYNGIQNEDILSHLASGHRLPRPSNCSQEFYTILQDCWENDRNRRPSFESLHEILLNLLTRGKTDILLSVELDQSQYQDQTQKQPDSDSQSSTNDGSDSAISEDSPNPLAVVVELHEHNVPSVVNPGYRKDSFTVPNELRLDSVSVATIKPGQCVKSTKNKRTSTRSLASFMKAIDLDSPSVQISRNVKSAIEISESTPPQQSIKLSVDYYEKSEDGSTEV